MKLYQIGTLLALTLTTLIAFQNCGRGGSIDADGGPRNESVARAELDTLEARMKSLAAEDLSCAMDVDCALVPVGASHCGLPTFELVSSLRNQRYEHVVSLAGEYRQLEATLSRSRVGQVSSCGAPVYPAPICERNTCVLPLAR